MTSILCNNLGTLFKLLVMKLISKEKLDLALKYLQHQRDLYKSFWVTATSLFGLIAIGTSLTILSGEVPEEYTPFLVEIVLMLIPLISLILLELFLRFFENNAIYKRITIYYSTEETKFENIDFRMFFNLIELNLSIKKRDKQEPTSDYLDRYGWVFSTKYRGFVSVILAILLDFLIVFTQFSFINVNSANNQSLVVSLVLILILVGLSLFLIYIRLEIHRYVKYMIKYWPNEPYWKIGST